MSKLLKFEFRKIFQQKSFYICFGVALLLMVLNIIVMKSLASDSDEIVFSTMSMTTKAISGSNFIMILGIFTALYVCDDFSSNTMKNIVSKGYKKEHIFLSKYISSLIVTLISALAIMVLTFLFSLSAGNDSETLASILPILLGQIIMILAYHALYFSLAMIIRKVGGSVAINLVGPMLVVTVLSLITSILKIDSLNINSYWLDSGFSDLVIGASNDDIIKAVVMGLAYFGIFLVSGLLYSRKKEI